jgi:hypothetical protein
MKTQPPTARRQAKTTRSEAQKRRCFLFGKPFSR